jgi:hypothetical protein
MLINCESGGGVVMDRFLFGDDFVGCVAFNVDSEIELGFECRPDAGALFTLDEEDEGIELLEKKLLKPLIVLLFCAEELVTWR